jgi:hypothetical protein
MESKETVKNRSANAWLLPTLFIILLIVIVVMVYLISIQNPGNLFGKPSLNVVSVEPGVSVTAEALSFPPGQTLEARIDESGSLGDDGIIVGRTQPGGSGNVIATYPIPAELVAELQLVLRLENENGYYAYQQFDNR